jgi:hypothetical protein
MTRASSPPRRSSRAKPASVPPPPSHSVAPSSSNSSTSARNDRSTRSINNNNENNGKHPSPAKSATPQSRASDEDHTARSVDPPPTRRSGRRMQEEVRKGVEGAAGREHDADAEDDDGETTRCICGSQEYPGPPMDTATSSSSHRGSRTDAATGNDGQNEEPGSLFIQCDTCEVWQHGGCVGIMTESVSPENYFCEQCRPELHRLMKNATGYVRSCLV